MSAREDQYIAGTCNIGRAETRWRRVVGWMGLVISLGLLAIFISQGMSPAWRLTIFVPASVSAIGFLQARRRFCVNYGLRGVFNFGSLVGRTDPIQREADRARDRRTSLRIIGQGVAIGAAIAAITYFVAV